MSTRKLATTMPAKARRPRATSGRSRAADGKLFRETKRKEDADARNSNRKYEVGRGKPPKATRFQKGKSGNPKGSRKKGMRISIRERFWKRSTTRSAFSFIMANARS